MTDTLEHGEMPEHLPAIIQLSPNSPPITLDQVSEAVLNELAPHELAQLVRQTYDLAKYSESEPSRVQAAKLLFDRLVPKKEDLEQKRREADERNAAIAEAKGLLADLAASRLAGLHQPAALDQESAPEPADTAEQTA
jgi:hypothetical protein